MPEPSDASFEVKKGLCFALYAYDVGFAVDLARCGRLFAGAGGDTVVRHNRRAPKYFDYDPQPLAITRSLEPVRVGPFETQPGVDMLIYDFGAVSVSFTIPFAGPLHSLYRLTRELGENPRLLEESRRQVAQLLDTVRAAVAKPRLSDAVEDYVILQADELAAPTDAPDVPVRFAGELARVLRAEKEALSAQEATDAMACRLSYGADDVTVVDWNAALVLDRDADDVRAVLEFANIELLEMRQLDRKLDTWLDQAYDVINRPGCRAFWRVGPSRSDMRHVAEMQMDGAILFERVSNAPKLLGDQYLARLYRLASQRFHLPDWNASILRKLDVIESIYRKMAERASSRRLEALEWIVILLIAFEVVLSLWPAGH